MISGRWATGVKPIAAQKGPGIDRLLTWDDGNTRWDIITDHRGSVIAAWNGEPAQPASATYDPAGRLTSRDLADNRTCLENTPSAQCTSPAAAPFAFVGAWRSPVTGDVHLRNRWYSPTLGQFVSRDPLGYADSFDPYGYASFDPVNSRDPLGPSAIDQEPTCRSRWFGAMAHPRSCSTTAAVG